MTDQSFAMTMHIATQADRPHFHWHFLGAGVTLYCAWQARWPRHRGRSPGPAAWSLDFAVTLTFIALLVPAVRTRADLARALVATARRLAGRGPALSPGARRGRRSPGSPRACSWRRRARAVEDWLVIACVSAVTYLLRASFIVFADPQSFLTRSGRRCASCRPRCSPPSSPPDCSWRRRDRSLAAKREAPRGPRALAVAARWRHPLAPIAVGMPVLWLLQWAMG
jgi:hypothetical protein